MSKQPDWFKTGAVVRVIREKYGHDYLIGSVIVLGEEEVSVFLSNHICSSTVFYSEECGVGGTWVHHTEVEPVVLATVEELLGVAP